MEKILVYKTPTERTPIDSTFPVLCDKEQPSVIHLDKHLTAFPRQLVSRKSISKQTLTSLLIPDAKKKDCSRIMCHVGGTPALIMNIFTTKMGPPH